LNTDPPAVVRRALERGWTTTRIVQTYPVQSCDVRVWRWRGRFVSSAAKCAAERRGLPIAQIQARLDAGASLREASSDIPVSWNAVRTANWNGAFLYPPQKRGWPDPDRWAKAARAIARRLRRDLGIAMLQHGMTCLEVADVLGCTDRAVRYWQDQLD